MHHGPRRTTGNRTVSVLGADLHFVVTTEDAFFRSRKLLQCFPQGLPKVFAIVVGTLVECSYLVHSRHDILPHREGGAWPEVCQAVDREDVEIAQPVPGGGKGKRKKGKKESPILTQRHRKRTDQHAPPSDLPCATCWVPRAIVSDAGGSHGSKIMSK